MDIKDKYELPNTGVFDEQRIVTEGELEGCVKIKDIKGTIIADKLLFDIKKQTLNIASFNDGKINANVKLKWKKDLEY